MKKQISIALILTITLGIFTSNIIAKRYEKLETYKPLLYVKTYNFIQITKRINDIKIFLRQKLNSSQFNQLSPFFANLLNNINHLNQFQSKNSEFIFSLSIVNNIDKKIQAALKKKYEQNFDRILLKMIQFSVKITHINKRKIKQLLAKKDEFKKTRYGYKNSNSMYILFNRNTLYFQNFRKIDYKNKVVRYLDSLHPTTEKEENHLIFTKFDLKKITSLYGIYMKNMLRTASSYRYMGTMGMAFSFLGRVLSKLYEQVYLLSPNMYAFWVDVEPKNKNIKFQFKAIGNLTNRSALRIYNMKRKRSIRSIQSKGQHKFNINKPFFYATIPLSFKDIIKLLNSVHGNKLFLIRDMMNFYIGLTDVLSLEDSKTGLWEAINSNADVFYYSNKPIDSFDLTLHKVAIALEIEKEAFFKKMFWQLKSLLMKRKGTSMKFASYKGKKYWIIKNTAPKLNAYLSANDGLFLFTNDLKLLRHVLSSKRVSGYIRANNTYAKESKSIQMPMMLKVNIKNLIQKVTVENQKVDKIKFLLNGVDTILLNAEYDKENNILYEMVYKFVK